METHSGQRNSLFKTGGRIMLGAPKIVLLENCERWDEDKKVKSGSQLKTYLECRDLRGGSRI